MKCDTVLRERKKKAREKERERKNESREINRYGSNTQPRVGPNHFEISVPCSLR